jgi:hypothetical protein
MHILADHGMHNAENASPDSDISSKIAGHRIAALSENVPRADDQGDGQKHQRGIGSGEARTGDNVRIGARGIKSGNTESGG